MKFPQIIGQYWATRNRFSVGINLGSKMRSHPLTLLSVFLLIVIGITSCHRFTNTPAPATSPSAIITPAVNPQPAASPQRFDGVSITVLANQDFANDAIKRRAPEFAQLTGAKVKLVFVPFGQLYQDALADFKQGTQNYSVVLFTPQWMIDFAAAGYLENLTTRVKADQAIQWNDIAPFFRNFITTYANQIYAIPLDGDFIMVYYRTDLLTSAGLNPPDTWEDYLAIAKQFHGKDLNGDGEPDYGSCLSRKPNEVAFWLQWAIASPFLQTQGTQQGGFFDPDTMQPLVNNTAFARALDVYIKAAQYGPSNQLTLGLGDSWNLFISGRCALSLDWGNIGTLSIDPKTSKVVNKVGTAMLPGTRQVLERSTGKLVDCNQITCPYAIEGINHAPYAAFGGWSGGINAAADRRVKDASYGFLSYMSQPAQANEDVTIGATGYNPYRISQFRNRTAWYKAGMGDGVTSKYLGAIGISLGNPNMVLDLRFPQSLRYTEALDGVLAQLNQGKLSRDEAIAAIDRRWNEITISIGQSKQRSLYRASLGL